MSRRLIVFAFLVLCLFVQSLSAQTNECSLEGVINSFQAAALSDAVDSWLNIYEASDCPRNVISAVRQFAYGVDTLKQNVITFESAMVFDGVDDYVELPPFELAPDFTIEVWANFTALHAWSRIIELGNGPNADNIVISNTAEDTPTLTWHFYNGGNGTRLEEQNQILIGQWINVAVTRSSNGLSRIYINGEIKTEQVIPLGLVTRSQNYLGRSSWSRDSYFDGQLVQLSENK